MLSLQRKQHVWPTFLTVSYLWGHYVCRYHISLEKDILRFSSKRNLMRYQKKPQTYCYKTVFVSACFAVVIFWLIFIMLKAVLEELDRSNSAKSALKSSQRGLSYSFSGSGTNPDYGNFGFRVFKLKSLDFFVKMSSCSAVDLISRERFFTLLYK